MIVDLRLDRDGRYAFKPAFHLVLHDVGRCNEVIDGQRERRCIGQVGIDDIFDREASLDGHGPLCNLLAHVSRAHTLGA